MFVVPFPGSWAERGTPDGYVLVVDLGSQRGFAWGTIDGQFNNQARLQGGCKSPAGRALHGSRPYLKGC